MSISSILRRLRLANLCEFKARLSYIARSCLIESKLCTVVQSYNSKPWEAKEDFSKFEGSLDYVLPCLRTN